jgi:hypothetical protein
LNYSDYLRDDAEEEQYEEDLLDMEEDLLDMDGLEDMKDMKDMEDMEDMEDENEEDSMYNDMKEEDEIMFEIEMGGDDDFEEIGNESKFSNDDKEKFSFDDIKNLQLSQKDEFLAEILPRFTSKLT